jgi:hypothetical protein
VRLFFFAWLLAGLAGGFGYPWMAERLSDAEIATIPVYNRVTGFSKAEVRLSPPQAPFRVYLRMTGRSHLSNATAKTRIGIYGMTSDRVEFISDVTFSGANGVTPQINGSVYEALAGTLPVENTGTYTFVFSRSGLEGIMMENLDLVIRGRTVGVDRRTQYGGFAVAALGFAGLILSGVLRKSRTSLGATGFAANFTKPAAISSLLALSALSLAGSLAVGDAYSWYAENIAKRELGRFQIFDRPSGFRPVVVNLAPEHSPAQLSFELTPLGNYQKPNSTTKLVIDVGLYGDAVFSSAVSFTNVDEPPKLEPDPIDKVFHSETRRFAITRTGAYKISAGLAGEEKLSMRRIYLVVASTSPQREDIRRAFELTLMAVGGTSGLLALLFFAVRRSAVTAEKPKWGRDAGG